MGLLMWGVFDAQRSNIRVPYYVLRHSHVIKWGAVIGLDARPAILYYLGGDTDKSNGVGSNSMSRPTF